MNSSHRHRNRLRCGPSPPRDPFDDWLALMRGLVLAPCKQLLRSLIRCVNLRPKRINSTHSHGNERTKHLRRRFNRP